MSQKQSKDNSKSILKRLFNNQDTKFKNKSRSYHVTATVEQVTCSPIPHSYYINPFIVMDNITIDKYRIAIPMPCTYPRSLRHLDELKQGDKLQFVGSIQRAKTKCGYRLGYINYPHRLNHQTEKRKEVPYTLKNGEQFIGYICQHVGLVDNNRYRSMIHAYETWLKVRNKRRTITNKYFSNAKGLKISSNDVENSYNFFQHLLNNFEVNLTGHEYTDIPTASILQVEWLTSLNVWNVLNEKCSYSVATFDNRFVCHVPYYKELKGEDIDSPKGWLVLQYMINSIYKQCGLHVTMSSNPFSIDRYHQSIEQADVFLKKPTKIKAVIEPSRIVVFKAPRNYSVYTLLKNHKRGMRNPTSNSMYAVLNFVKHPKNVFKKDMNISKGSVRTAKLVHDCLKDYYNAKRIEKACYGHQYLSLITLSIAYSYYSTGSRKSRVLLYRYLKILNNLDIWSKEQFFSYQIIIAENKNDYLHAQAIFTGIEQVIAVIRWRYTTSDDQFTEGYTPIFEKGGQRPLPIDFSDVMSFVKHPADRYNYDYDHYDELDIYQLSHLAHQVYDCLKSKPMAEQIKDACRHQEFIALKFLALMYFWYEAMLGGTFVIDMLDAISYSNDPLVPVNFMELRRDITDFKPHLANLKGAFLILECTIAVVYVRGTSIPKRAVECYRKGAEHNNNV